jgi:hypothetical protein
MRKRVASMLPIVASLITAVTVLATLPAHVVLAADDCLTEPNLRAAQRAHWYYRVDRVKNRKCWHLRQQDVDVPPAVSPQAQSSPKTMTQPTSPPVKRLDRRSAPPDPASRDALFQEFLLWQGRQGTHSATLDEVARDALFREFLLWQERQPSSRP